MASTTVKNAKRRQKSSRSQSRSQPITDSLLPKRLAAWAIETAVIGASALIPYQLGVWSSTNSEQLVPLHPVLAGIERQITPVRSPKYRVENRRVAPSTNLFWWIAIAAPAGLCSWQLYLLARTGQTFGKKLLKIRVVTPAGTTPGLKRAVFRELGGKWGIPLVSSYGIWRWSGAFPDGGILIGLAVVALGAEVSLCWLDYRRRALHDRIAGTLVVDARRGLATYPKRKRQRPQPVTVEVQNAYGSSKLGTSLPVVAHQPEFIPEGFDLWQWMRQNPGTTLMTAALAGTGLVIGTWVGTEVYVQNQANQRQYQEQNNEVFLSLVNQLRSTSPNPTVERQSVILALARLDDSRVLPLLVDLLSQETEPEIINTIEQALSSVGPGAIPYLRRLNQSLAASYRSESNIQRLGASKRAIAKILTLYSGQLQDVNLHRVDLTPVSGAGTSFDLNLEQINLSGINFRAANLAHSQLNQSRFFHPGKDQRWGTNDDELADLSGADLSYARLDRSDLSYVPLVRTNLVHADLNHANLSGAQLDGANFSSAELIGANLDQIVGDRTSFTGANLTEAQLRQAQLTAAHLSQVKAHATDFTRANLTQSSLSGADLTDASFEGASLQQADLSSTRMIGTNLRKAQLQDADLSGANLSKADLQGANLNGADLRNVSLASYSNSSSEDFIAPAPLEESVAQIRGVNFNRAKNLSSDQIEIICQFGGVHSQCR